MLKFNEILNNNDINNFVNTARKIWYEYFPSLISKEQIEYMLEKFQSFDAIKAQMDDGYRYFFIHSEENTVGYVVFTLKENYLFLSKLYFMKEFRGRGFGRQTLNFLENIAKKNQISTIRLTVNKYNEPTIQAYKKWGFEIAESKIFDIGNGYVMDDYIMSKFV